jgi:predicted permease
MLSAMTIILLSLVTGFTLKSIGRWKYTSAKVLNDYVIDIAFPALILASLPDFLRQTGLRSEDLTLALGPWMLSLLAIVFFISLNKMKLITRPQMGMLVAIGGFANTSFVGFPMLEGLMDKEIIPLAVIIDQFGTFLSFTFVGIIWLNWQSVGKRPTFKQLISRLVRFPPFLALCLSFPLSMTSIPDFLMLGFTRIGQTLVPVAMVSVGLQLDLNLSFLKQEWKPLFFGMVFKLFIAPLFFFIIYSKIIGLSGRSLEVIILEIGMAPMVTSTVLAMEAGLEPRLGALCLGLGIPLSLMTVPLIQSWLF